MSSPMILIVDDDPTQLALFSMMLRHLPYTIITVRSAEAAMKAIETARPALIILDVMMPRTDGILLLRTLRGDERWRDLKVVLLTILGDRLNPGAAALANKVLTKPIVPSVLEQAIQQVLGDDH